jgi:cation:H+ antiporter
MNPETVALSGELRISLLVLTIVAFLIYFRGKRDRSSGVPRIPLRKSKALMLVGLYVLYVVYVIGRSMSAEWTVPIKAFLHQLLSGLPVFT